MSKEEYSWVVALTMLAVHQLIDDDQDGPKSLEMKKVTGISGLLRDHHQEAANEMVARLFIFLLILLWTRAKHRAISTRNGPLFLKTVTNETWPAFSAYLAVTRMIAGSYKVGRNFCDLTLCAKSITTPQ